MNHTSQTSSYWAIGDVHGEADLLAHLINCLPLAADDGLIFLGDLVDRGPATPGVLDIVLRLAKEREVVVLRGNHEQMMLAARRDRSLLPAWLAVGGEATLDAYAANTFDAIPAAHWQLIEQSRLFFETGTEIYVHANLDAAAPLEAQVEQDLLWTFYERPIHHDSGKFTVCGHTPQPDGYPRLDPQSICIDTLNPPQSTWLTAVHLARQQLVQVNAAGASRREVFAALENRL